jgi:hypothetical protein
MFYEERMIDGVLMCSSTPNGEWRKATTEHAQAVNALLALTDAREWPPCTSSASSAESAVFTDGLGASATEVQSYEFHLHFWGEVENEKWVERDLGITEKDFWFPSKVKRDEFKARLAAVAESHKVIIAFGENEGWHVRLRTVARMTLTLPDGRVFPLEHDFGYAYPPESAEYMFTDGNYGCDCNRSLLLGYAGHDVEEMECGDEIKATDFKVSTEAPNETGNRQAD